MKNPTQKTMKEKTNSATSTTVRILIPIVICLLVVGCGPEPSIHEAAEDGDIKRVKQHLVEGVDVNAIYKDGWTPLHMATEGGHKKVVGLLILKDADLNVKNGDARTPMDLAIKHKNAEIADILRKHGGKKSGELKAEKETPSKGSDNNSTAAKSVKELTIKDVAGTYELKVEGGTAQMVFLENGKIEFYENGKINQEKSSLKMVGNEVHFDSKSGDVRVFRIEPNGDLTYIAEIEHGERHDHTKERQATFKKIK
jgi:ankyrin repeat protein